jgi:Mannose-6-phosphate isomerase
MLKTSQSIELNKEQVFHVEKEAWHQITNPFNEPCHIVEIQYGEKTDEDDIERLRFYDNEN